MSDHDALPLYVLDSLPDDERDAFDAHLQDCDRCAAELASYGRSLDFLASAAAVEPPAALREQVLAEVASSRAPHAAEQPVQRAGPRRSVRAADARRRARPNGGRWFALAAAVLALALIASTTMGVALWRRGNDLERQLTALSEQRAASDALTSVLVADDAELVDVPTDRARELEIVLSDSVDTGVVVADDLQAPPTDRAYQLWLIVDERPRSAGLVATTDGVLGVLVDVSDAQAVAVSIEPSGGSTAPTGPIVAQAALD